MIPAPPTTGMTSATVLTLDVLPTILSHIYTCGDLIRLCLVSRSVYYYATRRLYDGSLFRSAHPMFGTNSSDQRQYAKLLKILGDRPDLASRVRIFVVPTMKTPHERFEDMWERALFNCTFIEVFRWRSTLPIPLRMLQLLLHKSRLHTLDLPAKELVSRTEAEAIVGLHPLQELILLSPQKSVGSRYISWIAGMSESLRWLDLEGADWLEDGMLETLSLPHIRFLTLHDCPRITSAGVLPLLRSAPNLEFLYLGLVGVKIADIVRPEDRGTRPAFTKLRKISLNWERSLAFWINVQTLLASSPIETFHIIKSSMNSRNPGPNHLVPLSLTPAQGTGASAFGSNGWRGREDGVVHMMDDEFVRRFVHLHRSTLRKFWVVGMRCSEESVRELCYGCDKLERLRADDVDEFPLIERPAIVYAPRRLHWANTLTALRRNR